MSGIKCQYDLLALCAKILLFERPRLRIKAQFVLDNQHAADVKLKTNSMWAALKSFRDNGLLYACVCVYECV